ncbi:major tail protein [Mycobacterium phage Nairb]|uniref:Major tail protein n=5 Tax=Bernalvirus bernal13 TaxID=1982102 RepID=A0A2P1JRU3_9CAUD|nr:major tail protein [Mycobacterium phage Bernal13]AIT13427.1 major tail protein [Mycobacterium phage RonRayGun]ASJ79095.1 major tail protein [Mycobacterium phage ZenTime222]AVO21802.1 major tail protein [Mycobacterium phage Nairb]QBP28859.1 major tail protein [Mycobacterium phage Ibrahim]QHB47420.1 major tail protein [Mycobacterium phage Whitty]
MSGISLLQGGQADLELESADAAVLLQPYVGSNPILTLEDPVNGGLDLTKVGPDTSMQTVGNWTKDEGVTLTNSPTIVDIKSHGKGSPTKKIASEAPKGIRYTPQETNLLNLQNYWGFPVSAVSGPSQHGGITIAIPELPYNLLWRCVLLSWSSYNGKDVIKYWIANRASVGDRQDAQMRDSDVDKLGVSLSFETDPAVPGTPVIFGICGEGWKLLQENNNTGFGSPTPITAITATPNPLSLVQGGAAQNLLVKDSNGVDRTAVAVYGTSDSSVCTVSSVGNVTPVGVGSAAITVVYGGFTIQVPVTVTES